VPSSSVADLLRVMAQQNADGLVSFGGGSPIDTAKAALHARMTSAGTLPGAAAGFPPPLPPTSAAPHIAVPTTLSAGEFHLGAGVTDEATLTKFAIHDARIAPRTVITDPTLTLDTPAGSGPRPACGRSITRWSRSYSIRHHPFSDAVASRGLALLVEHLPRSMSRPGARPARAHRSYCQVAAWMSVFGMTNAGFGLSHALGHQIGRGGTCRMA
jgi:alcohol dehydrogenase